MDSAQKLRMARQLERLGVDVIEAGFPISSDGDFESVRMVAREIRRPIVDALARCRREDIERAWQAVGSAPRPRIHAFLATSDIHLRHKLKISRRECLEQAREGVRLAKSLCHDVQFSPEDATRTDPDFLCEILQVVIEAGATTLNIPDTVGYTVPSEFADLIHTLRRRVPGIERVTLSAHCHNDLGLAVANSLAAIAAGARQVECTVNGIGERAGNASLEELVMAMRVRPDRYPYSTAVASEELFPASQLLSEITQVPVQPNKAIIGRNAFAHEAGIHQDGVIKNPLTYEIMTPQSVGVPCTRLVLGKHSGRHALGLHCEQLGFSLERGELDRVYRLFVVLADHAKTVEDHQILELIRTVRAGSRAPMETVPALATANGHTEVPPHAAPLTSGAPLVGAPAAEVVISHTIGNRDGEQEDYLWGV